MQDLQQAVGGHPVLHQGCHQHRGSATARQAGERSVEYLYKEVLISVEFSRVAAFKNIAKIYIRYIVIYQNLDFCYDQMVHPQKRLLLRTLLDSTIGRIIELKVELFPIIQNYKLLSFSMSLST